MKNGKKRNIVGRCLLGDILYKKAMTQVDLEIITGINKVQINEFINNKRVMSLNNAKIISDALNCLIEDLYEWKNN